MRGASCYFELVATSGGSRRPATYRIMVAIGIIPGVASRMGQVNRTHCAEVLSRPLSQVRVLVIAERVEGFFLERFTDRGELVGTTQHDTMEEAMYQAYSEYTISEWRLCPDGVDPLEYIHARSDLDRDVTP
jgi:hypothetical protein